MSKTRGMLSWLMCTFVGNAVVITVAALACLSILFAVAGASNKGTDAPDTDRVVQQLVDTTTAVDAPSVNLTPNDPGYMSTTPAPAEVVDSTTVEQPVESTTVVMPPVVTDEPEPVETSTQPTAAPTTTAPISPTSPQADPNIIPLVIAWDGLKCPQPESFFVQARGGSFLLCPGSIHP